MQSRKVGNEFLACSGIANNDLKNTCFWDIKMIQDQSNKFDISILLNKNGVSEELNYKGQLEKS